MAESDLTKEGARVWIMEGKEDDWQPAVVKQCDGVEVVYKTDYGEERRMWVSEVDNTMVKLMSETLSEGMDDMAKMSELNQSSILCNLHTRYLQNKIYTYIGSILISVNPYKRIEGLYSDETLKSYSSKDIGDEPPHVFAIANECYTCMWKREENQCVLISGESGAGKTEATKFMLSFLSKASQQKQANTETGGENGGRSIEQSILETSPLLEAFGNAKTVYNNNSSRFGKFIQLLFSSTGQIKGGRLTDYLLEKHRVVRQNPGERNYHIFYQLMRGVSASEREELFLTEPEDFNYLNQSGCTSDPTLNDEEDWIMLEKALRTIGFKEGQITDMKNVLAGILQLGNVSFMNAGGAQVVDMDIVDRSSKLLGIDSERLEAVMKEKTMKLRGEYITSPQSIDQACGSRDSLSMAMYSQLFRWIIARINQRIKGPDDFHFIGILDIFGFENFEVNRFEQFCINFANEKLQEYFNRHIFSLEQIEYNREGIDWCEVEWADNSECLDLVEKNMGLISLINEESRFPKGTDNSLLQKLHNQHMKNQFYVKPKVTGIQFGIKHYAGEVFYTITGFLEKNRDTFRDDLLGLLKDSSCDLIYDMFEKVRGSSESSGKAARSKQAPTASGQFKKSLHSLMDRLSSANPFFVRCIKPNIIKVADDFNAGVVLNQLRYSGMLETVRVRKAGYPVRRLYQDFISRYWMILPSVRSKEPRAGAQEILQMADSEQVLWKMGKTKAFAKEMLEHKLEKIRIEKVTAAAIMVQSIVKACCRRKYYVKLRTSSVLAQKLIRGYLARHSYQRKSKAIRTIQRYERGRRGRKIYQVLLEEKKLREKKRLEAAIVIQTYTRGWAARKMFKVLLEKHRQLQALKEQMERERKQREEQARLERERKAREEEEERIRKQKEAELARQKAEEEAAAAAAAEAAAAEAAAANEVEEADLPPPPTEIPDEMIPASPTGSHIDALADLDAVIKQADVDSAYSTVNKRSSSETDLQDENELDEQERLEMERILQLEYEIAQMHRRTETRTSAASEMRRSLYIEDSVVIEEEVFDRKGNQDRSLEILQEDLGFEDFENQLDVMTEHSYKPSPEKIPTMEEWEEKEIENQEESDAYPISDDESYFTDSTFDDDDDDLVSEADVTGDAADRWSPDVYFHAYLDMKSGLMHQWKKRWCVLNNSTFMFFRSKQDSLKCGWLFKKVDGAKGTLRGTLPRKNWQKRWFTLQGRDLKFYETDEEGAKVKGQIELNKIADVTDVTEKENGIDIVMNSTKIYHLYAETTEEANDWYSMLMKIHSSSEKEIENMETEIANPKNALGTIDGQSIVEVSSTDLSGRANTFSITTSDRVYSLASDSIEEMHHWITLLNESKQSAYFHGTEGHANAIQQGWMLKTTFQRQKVTHQRRWFVLKPNAIEYYKTSDSRAPKLGSVGLNSLCLVTSPDDNIYRNTGLWQITVYGRKHTLTMSTEVEEDANIWSSEIQAMIDQQPLIVTKTKILLDKIKNAENDKEIDLIYKRNPILRQATQALRSPLLSLPYEQVRGSEEHFTLRDEAVRIFALLLTMEEQTFESVEDEARKLHEILRDCHGSKIFQDEIYLQLIKQTAIYTTQLTTEKQMCEQQHVTTCPHYWHLIACMCSAYHPSRPVLNYLKFHLKRVQEKYPSTFGAAYAAFAETALRQQSSKRREMVPSVAEICSVLEMRELATVIHCYGGATCDIFINSSTTVGKVVQTLQRGMQLEGFKNTFALFEHKGECDRALEPNTYVADALARLEILNEELRLSPDYGGSEKEWCLYFKLYCVFDPLKIPEDSIEYHFVFEDVHEQVIQGIYPGSEEIIRQLAAFRLQFVHGDYHLQSWEQEIEKFYPVNKVRSAYELTSAVLEETKDGKRSGSLTLTPPDSNTTPKKRSGSIFNTFRRKQMKKVKEDEENQEMKRTLYIQELQDVVSNVTDRWRRIQGMQEAEAVLEYVRLAQTWPGYGSYLFKVENHEAQFGEPLLTLAISADGASVYKRGHIAMMEHFSFQNILSFGAISANIFRIQTESRGDISFVSEHVNEIVKLMRAYVQALYKRHPRR